MARTAPKSVQSILTAGTFQPDAGEAERLKRFREALNAAVPEPAKPSPVLTTLTGAPKDAITPMAPMADISAVGAERKKAQAMPPDLTPMPAPAPVTVDKYTPVPAEPAPRVPGPRIPEPETAPPAPPAPPTRGEVPPAIPAAPTPTPAPAPEPEPIVKPTKKTGDEPVPEEPAAPAPPDRSPTATPREPVTTPSPPVAPTTPRTATPREETPAPPTAAPRRPRWSIKNLLAARKTPGGYGAGFAGGEDLPELTSFLQQQEAMRAGRGSRLQSLLGGQQAQPRVGMTSPRTR